MGGHDYSKEELVAEFTAAFLCAECRIDDSTVDNSEAYILGWVKVLKSNPRYLIEASGKAQKAVKYILKTQGGKNEKGNTIGDSTNI